MNVNITNTSYDNGTLTATGTSANPILSGSLTKNGQPLDPSDNPKIVNSGGNPNHFTVTWQNLDGAPDTVTLSDGRSGMAPVPFPSL